MAFISRVRLEARSMRPKDTHGTPAFVVVHLRIRRVDFVTNSSHQTCYKEESYVIMERPSCGVPHVYVGLQQPRAFPITNQKLIIINNIRYVYLLTVLRSIHTARHALYSGSN